MDAQLKKVTGLFARYVFLILISLGNLYLFYKILTPLTVFSVSKTLSLFTDVFVKGELIFLNNFGIELVRACVAGSAFFLMFLLVFSTPNIKPLKRLYAILTATALLFLFNFARIIFLVFLYSKENSYFDAVHWTLWHIVSVALVVGIWLFVVKIYKIKEVPIYSDIAYLYSLSKNKKKSKGRKKHKKPRNKNTQRNR